MSRPSIDETMLEITRVLAKRGTCVKKQVGCVLTDENNRILATGWNGAAHGMQHCTEESPCLASTDPTMHCHALHAEWNALIFCNDISKIRTVYITEVPCDRCLMMICNTGAKRIVWADGEKKL